MHKKVLNLILIALLGLILSACTLAASTPPPPTATAEGDFPFPIPTEPDILSEIMTQTAFVEGGGMIETEVEVEETPTPTMAPIPTLTRPSSYTLQRGEHPFCIARRYNLDVAQLLSINGLNVNSKPPVGTTLKIPESGNWNTGDISLKSHPDTYTVRSGDTIHSIACQYGDVSPEAIAAANGLEEPYNLTAGQVLQIP